MAPVFYKNGIVFTSNRKSDLIIDTKNLNDQYLDDLLITEKKGKRRWSNPSSFSNTINTRYTEGAATFDTSQTLMFFTRTRDISKKIGDKTSGDSTLGIFSSRLVNGQWTGPEAFMRNPEGYNRAYPCLSNDGQMLFFCSDEPGGVGGYDIYVSRKVTGRWQEPENLGNTVNTSEHDVFPFFHSSGRLYFASRGHGGRGGLDIFYSDYLNGDWREPKSMPDQFNSRYDDFALVINEAMDTGYFTSNRNGSDDIYEFVSSLPSFFSCSEQQINDYCGTFYEEGNIDLDTTTFIYEWDLGDGTKIRGVRADHCYDSPGSYLVMLNVVDTLTGEIYENEATFLLDLKKIQQPYIISPDTAYVDQEVRFDGRETNLSDFNIEEYYWDFDDGTRMTGPVVSHSFSRSGTYHVQLGVVSASENEENEPSRECVYKKIVVRAYEE